MNVISTNSAIKYIVLELSSKIFGSFIAGGTIVSLVTVLFFTEIVSFHFPKTSVSITVLLVSVEGSIIDEEGGGAGGAIGVTGVGVGDGGGGGTTMIRSLMKSVY